MIDKNSFWFGFCDGCVVMAFVFLIITLAAPKISILYRDGYKNGQIDYANGKIKYEFITTKEWKEKK